MSFQHNAARFFSRHRTNSKKIHRYRHVGARSRTANCGCSIWSQACWAHQVLGGSICITWEPCTLDGLPLGPLGSSLLLLKMVKFCTQKCFKYQSFSITLEKRSDFWRLLVPQKVCSLARKTIVFLVGIIFLFLYVEKNVIIKNKTCIKKIKSLSILIVKSDSQK